MAEMAQEIALREARERVAYRYAQPYHKNAIMAGDWDNGSIVRAEVTRVKEEHAMRAQREVSIQDDE